MNRTIDPQLRALLETAAGNRWRIVNGGKHRKIYVDDRFVAIMPHGGRHKTAGGDRAQLNMLAQVKRALRT